MTKVALLTGGCSREREVSLKSGLAVKKALQSRGVNLDVYDLTTNQLPEWRSGKPDVAFIAIHGGAGENGDLQFQLEEQQIPYTGSGPQACRRAMDKLISKGLFQRNGISTPESHCLSSHWSRSQVRHMVERMGFPVVVKPNNEGSSIGVKVARSYVELEKALEEILDMDQMVLIERAIVGREFTVGILGDTPLPVVELVTERDFFDFYAKYQDSETRYITSPVLPEGTAERIQGMALRCHQVLGCRHFSRVDFMMDREGELYVLELNTIPGLTSTSLLPKGAAAAGMAFPDLCREMIDLAMGNANRHRKSA